MPARPRNTCDPIQRAKPVPGSAGHGEPQYRHDETGALPHAVRKRPGIGSGYLVGLGSNLQPERNIPAIIRALALEFGALGVSPVIRTRPVGIRSHHDFLNAVVFVETDLSADRLKTFFNDIEERLGRDRSDSARHTKDRPADLDILLHCRGDGTLDAAQYPAEPYLRPPFLALCESMGLVGRTRENAELQTVALSLDGTEFGRHAQFLHIDGAGRVRDAADLREPAPR